MCTGIRLNLVLNSHIRNPVPCLSEILYPPLLDEQRSGWGEWPHPMASMIQASEIASGQLYPISCLPGDHVTRSQEVLLAAHPDSMKDGFSCLLRVSTRFQRPFLPWPWPRLSPHQRQPHAYAWRRRVFPKL